MRHAPSPLGRTSRRVLRYVVAHEGAHFRELQRDLGLSTGQADHHLRRLLADGLVRRTRLRHEVHFFPATRSRADRRPLAALQQEPRRRCVDALLAAGPSPVRALVGLTGIPESTLAHHLAVLVEAGVAFRAQEGRHVTYSLSDPRQAKALLRRSASSASAGGAPPPRGTLPPAGPRCAG